MPSTWRRTRRPACPSCWAAYASSVPSRESTGIIGFVPSTGTGSTRPDATSMRMSRVLPPARTPYARGVTEVNSAQAPSPIGVGL